MLGKRVRTLGVAVLGVMPLVNLAVAQPPAQIEAVRAAQAASGGGGGAYDRGTAFVPRKPLPPEQVKPLVEQLSAKDYKVRAAAGRALEAVDDRAIPALTAAMAATDSPEVQRRLEVLVERLTCRRAGSASLVTLSVKDVTLRTAVKEACKQAGYEFQGDITDTGKVSLEVKDRPFWEVIERLCEPAGVSAVPVEGGRGAVSFSSSEQSNPHTCVSGPYRIVAQNINSSRGVQLGNLQRRGGGNPQQVESINLSFQMYAEPKAPILAVGGAVVTKAVDDTGASLRNPGVADELPEAGDGGTAANNGYRTLSTSFNVAIVRGGREGTVIRSLKGKMPVTVLADVRTELEVDNILAVKKKKFAARSFDIDVAEVQEANGMFTVKCTLRKREADPNDDRYGWWNSAQQRIVLLDDKGNRLTPNGTSEQNVGQNEVTLGLQFSPPEGRKNMKPSKLVVQEWIATERVIEFEFKDIPLP